MHKSTIILGVTLALSLIGGCDAHRPITSVTQSVDSDLNYEQKETVQSTPRDTVIAPEPTLTKSFLEVNIQRSKDLLETQCLSATQSVLPKQEFSQGIFVTRRNTPYIYDLNHNTQRELQTPTVIAGEDYFVSPDGKWLAYQDYQEQEGKRYLLVAPLTNLQNSLLKPSYKWSHSNEFYVQGWSSENTILLTRWAGEKEYPTARISTVILNPFTDEEKEFNLEDYPNYLQFKTGGVGSYLFGHTNLLPNPKLTHMVYPEHSEHMFYVTLWDQVRGKAIVKLDFFHESITNDPLWAQDGKDFLIKNPGLDPKDGIEWFQVTIAGDVRQLTHFGMFQDKGFFNQASRSWDGKYLAFKWEYPWGETPENRIAKYFVIDLEAPELEGFCIDALPFAGGELPPPVWSIDSRYLVISNSNNGLGNLILVEVEKGRAYQIAKDVIARGWVAIP